LEEPRGGILEEPRGAIAEAPRVSPPVSPDGQVVEISCEILVVGAGLGGTAAALRAARLGRRVCLIEETGWPGGQISTQGVSALDEHQYIETFGGTAAYYELREGIRAYYREQYTLAPSAQEAPDFNPGSAWASRLSFEPRAGAAVLDRMMAGPHDSGDLQVFYHTRAVAAEVYEGRIASVLTRHLESGGLLRFRTSFVIDGTDLGDMLPLSATAYVMGAESRAETGEPSAPDVPDRTCIQHFTFPFAVEFAPGENHTIPRPEGYERNRDEQPYSLAYTPWRPDAPAYRMFDTAPGTAGAFWTYRRALNAQNFDDPRIPHDISIINWSSNDFRGGIVVDRLPDEQAARYRQARLLSLGFLYWLQTEVPRDDGGRGYPELKPRPDVMGSADGLSQAAYVREGRRLVSLRRILEQDISARTNPGPRAAPYGDAVGVGLYPIDLHGCNTEMTAIPTKPFQIPLGALVPVHTTNLLPASKNIGTTHLTNGAYRLHPVEWAIGEAAAVIAVFTLMEETTPQQVHARPRLRRRLQLRLIDQGIPLYWYDDVPLGHSAFAATQLLAVDNVWTGSEEDLHFRPEETLRLREGKRLIGAAARSVQRWKGEAAADPRAGVLRPTPEDADLPLRREAAATLVAHAIPSMALPPDAGTDANRLITRAELAIWLGAIVAAAIETPES
jgi:hypothetical protein